MRLPDWLPARTPQALTTVIKNSTAQTMMGLERELKDAAASLQRCNPTAISLKAGCELFLRCVGPSFAGFSFVGPLHHCLLPVVGFFLPAVCGPPSPMPPACSHLCWRLTRAHSVAWCSSSLAT